MERKLLAVIDAIRLEVDGQEILLIKAPIKGPPPPPDATTEEATKPMDYLTRLQKQIPVVLVWLKFDGTIAFVVPPQWREKIESRTRTAFHWTKVPIYEDDSGLRF